MKAIKVVNIDKLYADMDPIDRAKMHYENMNDSNKTINGEIKTWGRIPYHSYKYRQFDYTLTTNGTLGSFDL